MSAVSSRQVFRQSHPRLDHRQALRSRHPCTVVLQLWSVVLCTACAPRSSAIIALRLGNSCPSTWAEVGRGHRMHLERRQLQGVGGIAGLRQERQQQQLDVAVL